MSVFKEYAKYYDLLYKDKDYSQEISYIDSLIRNYTDKKDIIEFGCGSGLHAIELAKLGYSVFGLDISDAMITQANDRLEKQHDNISNLLSFNIGDAKKYSGERKFNVALSLFHVISYMQTKNDLVNTFKTVNNSLNIGGLFLFDFWYGPGVLNDPPKKVSKYVTKQDLVIKRETIPFLNKTDRLVEVNFDLSINRDDIKIDTVQECHIMRYFFKDEMIEILESNNFDVLYSKEWLTHKELSKETWYACFLAKKIR